MKFKDKLQEQNLSIVIPNELFAQLLRMKEDKELKPVHIGFTYSYIYLQTYMYRYSTYDSYVPSVEEIKELLTYSPNDQRTNYIIKKNGLLEQKDILTTTNDFPIISEMVDDEYSFDRVIKITTIQEFCKEIQYVTVGEWRNQMGVNRRTTCKYPVFAFKRYVEDDEGGVFCDGTFFDISNTHLINMNTFLFCMITEDIGVNGFYVYAYLLDKSNKFADDFRASYRRIAQETGLSFGTISSLMNALRSHNLIVTVHNMEYFSPGRNKNERIASSHKVNKSEKFSVDKIDYEKLKFLSKKAHVEKTYENLTFQKITIKLDDLPF